METLEELQAILDKAPEDATHIDDIKTYWRVESEFNYDFFNGDCWDESEPLENGTRSLADIQRIVDLMVFNSEMHQQVNGYLHGEDWEHWQVFNQKRFSL